MFQPQWGRQSEQTLDVGGGEEEERTCHGPMPTRLSCDMHCRREEEEATLYFCGFGRATNAPYCNSAPDIMLRATCYALPALAHAYHR